jgi:hypothetical protein
MTVDTYTSSNTWLCPTNVTSVQAECWGGGAGGRNSGAGDGGGGGAYAKKLTINVTPGNTYTVTVGTGGASNAAGNDSWFSSSSTVLAKGAASKTGGQSGSCIGDTVYSGGNGGTQAISGAGGGSSAGTAATGNNGSDGDSKGQTGGTGATAPSGGGNGGSGGADGEDGTAGSQPGGGGGGNGQGGTNGGAGAAGKVVLTYTTGGSSVPTGAFFALFRFCFLFFLGLS